ncbi:MAG TPA: serpin family protein [Verrucomicrobiota bacterium]|nr:serpin family protein [Verrucomicrobiales bacterium]HRI14389.1 serpin family protein [Verrucomicrobiota bacterium]
MRLISRNCPATLLALLLLIGAGSAFGAADETSVAAQAVNVLGLKLLERGTPNDANALISPYSIQTALAMTYAGADGKTRAEMERVLSFGTNESQLHASFAALRHSLDQTREHAQSRVEVPGKPVEVLDPIALAVANRLFGEKSFKFLAPFLQVNRDLYAAPLQGMDFRNHPDESRLEINRWVAEKTQDRIEDLIPANALDSDTRLVLVNAIYLKAPWKETFAVGQTEPEPFYVRGQDRQPVPTMKQRDRFGYRKLNSYSAISLPYEGGELQFLILLPDSPTGLPNLEKAVTPERLSSFAELPNADLDLHLPKLKLQPPVMRLGKALQDLGMTTAFDIPSGSADFSRMAPRKSGEYLKISEVFHKTFLDLDEKGTEAAAATAVQIVATAAFVGKKPEPIVVRVDRPFLFAIQHRPSKACLFLGRVVDPR